MGWGGSELDRFLREDDDDRVEGRNPRMLP